MANSPTTMASFPEEIITEILSRLPVKSLLRFTIVCKSWKSLIQSPNFIKLHLNQTLASSSNRHLIISHESIHLSDLNLEDINHPLSFTDLHPPFSTFDVFFHGCCNGIFCFSDHLHLVLYNPLTKWHRRILGFAFSFRRRGYKKMNYILGYDSFTDDYKIFTFFRIHYVNCDVTGAIKVFSFKRNSWKHVESIYDVYYCYNRGSVSLNDAVYRIVRTNKSVDEFILKFDCRTDTVLRINGPRYDVNDKIRVYSNLCELKGCLCMLVSSFWREEITGCSYDGSDFWMMKKSTWVKLFQISESINIGVKYEISVVLFSKDGRKIMLQVDKTNHGWYDLEDGSFETVTFPLNNQVDIEYACCTLGSLVSLVDNGTVPTQV